MASAIVAIPCSYFSSAPRKIPHVALTFASPGLSSIARHSVASANPLRPMTNRQVQEANECDNLPGHVRPPEPGRPSLSREAGGAPIRSPARRSLRRRDMPAPMCTRDQDQGLFERGHAPSCCPLDHSLEDAECREEDTHMLPVMAFVAPRRSVRNSTRPWSVLIRAEAICSGTSGALASETS